MPGKSLSSIEVVVSQSPLTATKRAITLVLRARISAACSEARKMAPMFFDKFVSTQDSSRLSNEGGRATTPLD
jgi:hypothetical protein